MHDQYIGILVLIVFAAIVCAVMVTGSWLLGPKKVTPYKQAPYECGVEPVGDARQRFPIKFYLVAMLFILFDIESVFLWSWMTVYKSSTIEFMTFSFFEFIAYMATWVLGYIYVIRVGALDWDETISLAAEKLIPTTFKKELPIEVTPVAAAVPLTGGVQ